VNNEEHAKGLEKATAAQETKWWLDSKYKQMEGSVLAKSKTPFAVLWTDRYPIDKSE
jgi:hypothetical protein